MNISESGCNSRIREVGRVPAGTVVKFLRRFTQGHDTNTPFMVCVSPDGYRPDHDYCGTKIPVVHMRTGKISYVRGDREVQVFHAECNIAPEQG